MAESSCIILTVTLFILASGGGLVAVLALYWDNLEKGSLLKINWFRDSNATSLDDVHPKAESLFAGWILITTVLTTILTILTGFWGFICGCRRGQFESFTFLVLSVATAIFSCCLLVAVSVVLAAHCHENTDKCMDSVEKDYYIALFSIAGLTIFILLLTAIASCMTCKYKCQGCGAADERQSYYVSERNSYPMGERNPGYPEY